MIEAFGVLCSRKSRLLKNKSHHILQHFVFRLSYWQELSFLLPSFTVSAEYQIFCWSFFLLFFMFKFPTQQRKWTTINWQKEQKTMRVTLRDVTIVVWFFFGWPPHTKQHGDLFLLIIINYESWSYSSALLS